MSCRNRTSVAFFVLLFGLLSVAAFADSAPEVTNVTAEQRTDGSGIVDIQYTLSDDGGNTWDITPSEDALAGDVGPDISSGERSIEWDSKADLPGEYGTNYRVKVAAEAQDHSGAGADIVWVDIPDSNADYPADDDPDGVGFTGEMSKYPTTNAQYAQYLNEALSSGDIEVDDNQVRGTTGDYAGERYYRLDGPGNSGYGATNGGKSRISYSGGVFTVDSGFENHPVTYVSWHGATAFAEYYGWRLPTEWEWESVANYNDDRTYATGSSLKDGDEYLANPACNDSHEYAEYGTTPVGHFGTFGYGMADMAGNVWDWTSTVDGSFRVFRGASWNGSDFFCTVSYRHYDFPVHLTYSGGFRVCR